MDFNVILEAIFCLILSQLGILQDECLRKHIKNYHIALKSVSRVQLLQTYFLF